MTQSVSCSVGLGVSLSANRSCHPFLFSHFGTFKALKTQKGKGIAEMGAAAISAATGPAARRPSSVFGLGVHSEAFILIECATFGFGEKGREEKRRASLTLGSTLDSFPSAIARTTYEFPFPPIGGGPNARSRDP